MTTSLLIDYNKIIKPSMSILLKKLKNPPKTKYSIGLILIIPKEQYKKLNNKEKGSDSRDYLNTQEFVTKIKAFFYVVYDLKNDICEIWPTPVIYKYLTQIIESISSGISKDVTIWVGFSVKDVERYMEVVIENGFVNPYICKKSALGYIFPHFGVGLYKKNIGVKDIDLLSRKNEISYVVSEFNQRKNKCGLYIKFTPKAVGIFKKLSSAGTTKNKDGTTSQKELGGDLVVSKIRKIDGKIVYILDVDSDSISSGVEEEIQINSTRYNFHSHPQEAYKRHKVHNGWPSHHDYSGFLDLEDTIFHCVVTIEGIYVISFNYDWKGKVTKKFIEDNYDIDHKEDITPEDYEKKINNIKNKGSTVFSVKYIRWDKFDQIYAIYYEKDGVSCISTEEGISDSYKRK